MYLRVAVRRSLDSVIVYDTFIYMIFDILFVLSYFIYFDRMSPKIKFTYLLIYHYTRRTDFVSAEGRTIFWGLRVRLKQTWLNDISLLSFRIVWKASAVLNVA